MKKINAMSGDEVNSKSGEACYRMFIKTYAGFPSYLDCARHMQFEGLSRNECLKFRKNGLRNVLLAMGLQVVYEKCEMAKHLRSQAVEKQLQLTGYADHPIHNRYVNEMREENFTVETPMPSTASTCTVWWN